MNSRVTLRILFACLIATAGIQAVQAAETLKRYYAHDAVEDQHGVIAPWYQGQNGQFDYRVRIASETLRRYPWVTTRTAAGIAPAYAFNNTWRIAADGTISIPELNNWYNAGRGQGSARAILAWVDYYRYTSDPAALAHLEVVADTVIRFSQTDARHPWPNFLISVPVEGKIYGQADPDGWIQLDIVGETAVALLKAYQLTGNERWLATVKHWADVFVEKRNRTPGAAPWDRYANPEKTRWGMTQTGNIQTGGLVYQLVMLDELIRLGYTGRNNDLVEARDAAREYLRDVLLPAWAENDTWGRSYWDWEQAVQGQTITDWTVRYLMDNKDYFSNWKNDVRNILTLFLNHTSVATESKSDVYSGAWAFSESSNCCGTSLAWGPMELALDFAQYAVEADDEWAREMARRQQILATYEVHDTGVVEDNIFGGALAADGWMNAAVPSSLKWVLRTMGWLPEIMGASRENHVMRSTAVINSVTYGKGRVQYSTFDAPANTIDVLRLAFEPVVVSADGKPLGRRSDLAANGYTVKVLATGDSIVSIRHDGSRKLVVEGDDPQQVADDGNLQFKGKWTTTSNRAAWGGAVRTTSRSGSAMEFSFNGNQLRLVGAVGPAGGKADVYVDGVRQLVGIDFWNPRELQQQVVYYRNGLSQGQHTVRIVAQSDRNPLSKGTLIAVDAVQYSAAQGENGYGSGGGPAATQRMIFGYTGRQDYVDAQGHSWRPGTEFVVRTGYETDSVARSWWTTRQAIHVGGTASAELYRYGVHAPELAVNVTVAPGNYYVRLKFSENHYLKPNQRAIDIFINDRKVVGRLDVLATAAASKQYQETLQDELTPERYRQPAQYAVDLVFNDVKPANGIIEIRLVGESVNGLPTEAILNSLEVGQANGGEGSLPVSCTVGN